MRFLTYLITIAMLLAGQPAYSVGGDVACGADEMAMTGGHGDLSHDKQCVPSSSRDHGHDCSVGDGCNAPGHCNPTLLASSVFIHRQAPVLIQAQATPVWVQPDLPSEIEPPRT